MTAKRDADVIYTLLKDEVSACALDLGISEEQVAYGILKGIRKMVDLEIGRWPLVDTSNPQDVADCPLGLDCYPSCAWWSEGSCLFMKEAVIRGKQMKKTKNPYPQSLNDEASGVQVPDARHEIWADGYRVGQREALHIWLAEYFGNERGLGRKSKEPRASLP
ncbi:MAG TPA: hypothetical protein G4O09_09170 [Dehalococcoidia bacterium]|nr:hypothetical protein [Dehalococcoidia bacterium]